MNNLHVFDHQGVQVADSREVAAMVDKQHKNLLRDIAGYIESMEKSTELKIEPSDFFIPSEYLDSTGRTLPRYLLTKKGCDMVANKMTGEKGVIFTAAYVTAFEAMREHIQKGTQPDYSGLSPKRAKAQRLYRCAFAAFIEPVIFRCPRLPFLFPSL